MKAQTLLTLCWLGMGLSVAQNIGIGTASPGTKLDVQGDIGWRTWNLTLANGGNGTLSPTGLYSYYRITGPTAAFSISGLGGGVDGRVVTLYNATAQTMTLANLAGGGTQFRVGTSDLAIGAWGSATLQYNTTDNLWALAGVSQAATAWALDGNSNGGLYTLGTNDNYDLPIETNNSERMRILASNGHVGIGTAAPTEPLHVFRNSNADKAAVFGQVRQTSTSVDYDNIGLYGLARGASATWGYSVGVAAVADAARSWGTMGLYAGLGMARPDFAFGSSNFALYADAGALGDAGIFMNGNVGIGTEYPQQSLSVQTGANIDQADGNTGTTANALTFGSFSGEGIGSKRSSGGNQYGLDLYTNSTARVQIYNDGNVVVNETGADADFRIEADGRTHALWVDAGNNAVRLGASSGTLTDDAASVASTTVDYVADFDLGSSAGTAVGIGSIEYLLDLNNETSLSGGLSPTVHLVNDIGFSSTTRSWDDVYADDFVNVSDGREKSGVEQLPYGLREVMQMRPVRYKLDADPFQEPKLGLIAQELLPLVQEAVKAGDYKQLDEAAAGRYEYVAFERMGVKYTQLIPVLIKAIQEQQAAIAALQSRVDALEGRQPAAPAPMLPTPRMGQAPVPTLRVVQLPVPQPAVPAPAPDAAAPAPYRPTAPNAAAQRAQALRQAKAAQRAQATAAPGGTQ